MKVKILSTTMASGDRVIQGAIEDLSDKDAKILISIKKARPVKADDKDDPVEKKAVKTEDAYDRMDREELMLELMQRDIDYEENQRENTFRKLLRASDVSTD